MKQRVRNRLSAADDAKAYRYAISLRLRHPSLNLAKAASALGVEPSRSWRAGEPRTTPKGNPLLGIYRDSYWTAPLSEGEWPGRKLPTVIRELLDGLSSHTGFFHRIHEEGGKVEFFISWYFNGNSGGIFDHKLMAELSAAGIDLALDVYPPDPTSTLWQVAQLKLARLWFRRHQLLRRLERAA